jgi:glycosyltransferase involved in cell wall biosynthesis
MPSQALCTQGRLPPSAERCRIMAARRYRVLIVATHAVQYSAPIYRQMARHPDLDIEVAYCSLQGAESGMDAEFGKEVKWDIPLLDGYPWTLLQNRAIHPGPGRFFGFLNTGLWRKLRHGRYDALVLSTGYRYATFWIGLLAAKLTRIPVLFGTDAISLAARDGAVWKSSLKRYFWPVLFRLADQVIVPSTGTREMMRALRIPERRMTLTPYVVDNEWWTAQSSRVDRAAVRAQWNVPANATVILFCAKLQPWKRPLDLLRAFARTSGSSLFLIIAGDGPLYSQIAREAAELGVADRVRLLGFMNQSQLPSVYRSSDVLVLPSEYEPFGVVVNEALLCGCVAAVSDRVGAGRDLIHPENGFVFPCGDVDRLAGILQQIACDAGSLKNMSQSSKKILEKWSPQEHIEAYVEALNRTALSRGTAA